MSESRLISLLQILCILSTLSCFASASTLVCPRPSNPLLLNPNCPFFFFLTPPRQVTGETLEQALASQRGDAYTSVLFYASWCPFSKNAYMIFEVMSSMYPQIEHLAVEQSTVRPSLLSRYSIHSVPAIFMIRQTSKFRFHGSKEVSTLMKFYKKTTGFEPHHFIAVNDFAGLESRKDFVLQSWIGLPMNAILKREPYLVVSLLFLFFQLLVVIYPRILRYLRALMVSCAPHLNFHIVGETSQILGQALRSIDVKSLWTMLKLCKSARNARVFASSLASVSLSESSAAKSSSSSRAF